MVLFLISFGHDDLTIFFLFSLHSLDIQCHWNNNRISCIRHNGYISFNAATDTWQSLGVVGIVDRSLVKKKIRDMKHEVEKERKALEKELKNREKIKQKEAKASVNHQSASSSSKGKPGLTWDDDAFDFVIFYISFFQMDSQTVMSHDDCHHRFPWLSFGFMRETLHWRC